MSTVAYESGERAAWITLARPEKLNALRYEDWRVLGEYLERGSRENRVIVIVGSGDAFCVGDDINDLASLNDADDFEKHGELLSTIYDIEELPVPVIAAVDGPAYGAGMEIVGACDLAVATQESQFAFPEARIGGFSPFAAERVAVLGGRKRVMELTLLGEPIDAHTAREWGLVNRVVRQEELESTVDRLVSHICTSPRRSIRATKQYTNRTIRNGRERERMMTTIAHLFASPEAKEGVKAFLEGREPQFKE